MQERDKLRTTKNQLRQEIENVKIKEENNIKAIKDLDSKIPRQKTKISELEEKKQKVKDELVKVQAQCEKSDLNLIEMKNELTNIKTLAVSEHEMKSIVSAKETIEKQLEEQEQISIAGRQKLKEHSRLIEEAHAITVKMETIQSSFKIDAGDMKTKKKAVENLNAEVSSLKSNIAKFQSEIESLSQSLEIKNKSVAELLKKRDDLKTQFGQRNAEQTKELKEMKNLLRKLTIQEAALSSENQRITNDFQQIYKVASSVIKHISNQVFAKQNSSQD